jgi:hypothetical protein
MGVIQHAILAYPLKGHTHGPLDGVFGQICVKLGNTEFNSASDVVEALQSFLDTAAFDGCSDTDRRAYKMDESPSWESWWDEVGLELSDLTGPRAPHFLHICKRSGLDLHEMDAPPTAWLGAPPPAGEDIVVAVKDRMSSLKPHQVALLVPAREVPFRRAQMSVQPTGSHPRRSIRFEERKLIRDRAAEVFQMGGIDQAAYEFLTEWSSGTLRRIPRPNTYEFLNANRPALPVETRATLPACFRLEQPPRPIVVQCADHLPLPPATQEEDNETDPLTIFTEE